ncbi:hypothetical protein BJ508DRAFT_47782 [Ascobolus immersus RN42]|uniref:Uncharacterized protein n=1 Tax=Ascobolus immersus RN42 TaxID=1160509 RepID=A0A3N4IDA0_ASCIM|nr:hypothetical protein BJ508DRAFT_47782 [Ascobolus immersus RN42]
MMNPCPERGFPLSGRASRDPASSVIDELQMMPESLKPIQSYPTQSTASRLARGLRAAPDPQQASGVDATDQSPAQQPTNPTELDHSSLLLIVQPSSPPPNTSSASSTLSPSKPPLKRRTRRTTTTKRPSAEPWSYTQATFKNKLLIHLLRILPTLTIDGIHTAEVTTVKYGYHWVCKEGYTLPRQGCRKAVKHLTQFSIADHDAFLLALDNGTLYAERCDAIRKEPGQSDGGRLYGLYKGGVRKRAMTVTEVPVDRAFETMNRAQRAQVIREKLLAEIQTVVPKADMGDVFFAVKRTEELGYRWVRGGYEEPKDTCRGKPRSKDIGKYTLSEGVAILKALKDGSLRVETVEGVPVDVTRDVSGTVLEMLEAGDQLDTKYARVVGGKEVKLRDQKVAPEEGEDAERGLPANHFHQEDLEVPSFDTATRPELNKAARKRKAVSLADGLKRSRPRISMRNTVIIQPAEDSERRPGNCSQDKTQMSLVTPTTTEAAIRATRSPRRLHDEVRECSSTRVGIVKEAKAVTKGELMKEEFNYGHSNEEHLHETFSNDGHSKEAHLNEEHSNEERFNEGHSNEMHSSEEHCHKEHSGREEPIKSTPMSPIKEETIKEERIKEEHTFEASLLKGDPTTDRSIKKELIKTEPSVKEEPIKQESLQSEPFIQIQPTKGSSSFSRPILPSSANLQTTKALTTDSSAYSTGKIPRNSVILQSLRKPIWARSVLDTNSKVSKANHASRSRTMEEVHWRPNARSPALNETAARRRSIGRRG